MHLERPEVLGALARLCDAARDGMGTDILDDERLLGFFFFVFCINFLLASEGTDIDDERLLGFFSSFIVLIFFLPPQLERHGYQAY